MDTDSNPKVCKSHQLPRCLSCWRAFIGAAQCCRVHYKLAEDGDWKVMAVYSGHCVMHDLPICSGCVNGINVCCFQHHPQPNPATFQPSLPLKLPKVCEKHGQYPCLLCLVRSYTAKYCCGHQHHERNIPKAIPYRQPHKTKLGKQNQKEQYKAFQMALAMLTVIIIIPLPVFGSFPLVQPNWLRSTRAQQKAANTHRSSSSPWRMSH